MLVSAVSAELTMALQAAPAVPPLPLTPAMREIEPVEVRTDLLCFLTIAAIPRTAENAPHLGAGMAHFRARVRTQLSADQLDATVRALIADRSLELMPAAARRECYLRAAQIGAEMVETGRIISAAGEGQAVSPR